MMAVNVKQLSETGRAWLDEAGQPINLDRAWGKSDRMMEERRIEADLLAAAGRDVAGDRRWFAVRTAGVSEIDLCKRLTDSRVDAVVPVKSVPVKRRFNAPSRKLTHKPVLGGLVFVSVVESDQAFAGLLRIRGVAALIGTHGRPHPIGNREMNGFMDLAQAGAFDERNTPTGLQVGSRVKINVGPYAQFRGVLEGYAKGRSARVKTWLFGSDLIVDVKLAHLTLSE